MTAMSTKMIILFAAVVLGIAVFFTSIYSKNEDKVDHIRTVSSFAKPAPDVPDLAAATARPQSPTSVDGDPSDIASSAEVVELHRRVMTRRPDGATDQAERRVASALKAGSPLAATADGLEVKCAADVCEMTGRIRANADDVQRDLSNPLWLDTLPRLGYMPGPIVVTAGGSETRFVQYLKR